MMDAQTKILSTIINEGPRLVARSKPRWPQIRNEREVMTYTIKVDTMKMGEIATLIDKLVVADSVVGAESIAKVKTVENQPGWVPRCIIFGGWAADTPKATIEREPKQWRLRQLAEMKGACLMPNKSTKFRDTSEELVEEGRLLATGWAIARVLEW